MSEPRLRQVPARVRIMGWLLGLMVAVLGVVVLMVWQLSLTDVDNRVNRGLEQEVREFADFVSAGRDPRTGEPISDPTRLLAAHLSTQYPENNEVHVGVVVQPDRMTIRVEGNPAYDMRSDETLFRRIVDAPTSCGDTETEGGAIRWAKTRLSGGADRPVLLRHRVLRGRDARGGAVHRAHPVAGQRFRPGARGGGGVGRRRAHPGAGADRAAGRRGDHRARPLPPHPRARQGRHLRAGRAVQRDAGPP